MLLRIIQRAAVIEDLLWKVVGKRDVKGKAGSVSIRVPVKLIEEAQALLKGETKR